MLRETYMVLILYLKCTIGESDLQVDYSDLAGRAENNKEDILSFLKQPSVREQYKLLYNSLLKKLIETPKPKTPQNSTTSKPAHNRRDGVTDAEVIEGSTRRIVSGRNTSIAAVPWQVSLRAKTFPVCGGSVITDIWLITAAHCLLKARASDLSVRLGSSWKTHGGEMYDVKSSLVHPKYSTKTKIHDVGLIELYSQLRFSAKVLPIGFVNKNTRLKAESPAIVSGWGKLKESGPVATYLQSTTIKTIAMKLCKNSGLDSKSIDPSTMFCAGSFTQPSPDACQGDSGGPIVYDGILIGVVSWGLGCARGNFPGVYTRLSNPVTWDWIHNQISKKTSNCTVR